MSEIDVHGDAKITLQKTSANRAWITMECASTGTPVLVLKSHELLDLHRMVIEVMREFSFVDETDPELTERMAAITNNKTQSWEDELL